MKALLSAVVVLVLIPRGEHQHIKVANGEERDTPAMAEWDDELSKLPLLLASATSVRRKREDRHCALYSVAESKQARVVRRIAGQFALDDVFLEALDVLLERRGGYDPIPGTHSAPRLAFPDTAARMRCCAACAR